jgi:curved DNA-binding protein CbpA
MGEENERELLDRILSPVSSHYEVLGVPRDAPKALVTKEYRVLAKRFHPDTYRGEYPSEAMEAFKRFSTAAEILRDESSRIEYDAILRQQSYNGTASHPMNSAAADAEEEPRVSELEKERQWYHANIYFLREMLTLLREDATADISDYAPAILATLFLGTEDLLQFLYSNPLHLIPLAFLALYLAFSSNASRQEMMDRISWDNLSAENKIKLVEFLIAYNEHRLSQINL